LGATEVQRMQTTFNNLSPDVSLALPSDLQTEYFPTGCPPGGMMRFNGYTLDVMGNVFSKLSTYTDTAAAYLHEALYKIFRDTHQVTTSIEVRRLVACLFSDPCVDQMMVSIPTDRPVFKCHNDEDSIDGYVYPTQPIPEINGKTSEWTLAVFRLQQKTFGAMRFLFHGSLDSESTHYQEDPPVYEGVVEYAKWFGQTPFAIMTYAPMTTSPGVSITGSVDLQSVDLFYFSFLHTINGEFFKMVEDDDSLHLHCDRL
jgi:hypothetical protein